ncbi:MAG: FxsA family protein [Pseudomonadota bacterium]
MRVLFLLFIIVPVLEMWLLITIGQLIGALPTIGLVLLTAIIGVNLLRAQGLSTLTRAQERMASGAIPAQEMAEGMALAVGGALLLTPGFATDAFGFACLIPITRKWLAQKALSGLLSSGQIAGGPQPQGADNSGKNTGPVIIEGEYQDASEEAPSLEPKNKFTDRA